MQTQPNLKKIAGLLEDQWGFKPDKLEILPGYDNLNLKVITGDDQYILKVQDETDHSRSMAESRLLEYLATEFPENNYPRPVLSRKKEPAIQSSGMTYRTLTWLEGDFLSGIDHSPELIHSFGSFMAATDLKLMRYTDPVITARHYSWDLQYFMELRSKAAYIPDPEIRKLVNHYILQFREAVIDEMPSLRKSVIHNDANDNNVLVKDNKVTGLIDFGDVVFAPIIQEVAVAITYVMMDKTDPLQWAVHFLHGYHDILPLNQGEVDLLYYLVAARLCISLIHSYEAIYNGTADEYTLISQQPAVNLLKKWIAISPDKVSRDFRKALEMPVPQATDYPKEIENRHQVTGKILSVSYQKPIKMQRAVFQYMFDADGNTYLDAYNNIPHVGHQHPRVVEAAQRQMVKLNTNTRYLYNQLADYAEKLLAKFPKPLNKVFFVNSGSEASDLAIRMAQTVTRNKQVAVLEHGYHGNTRMGIDISHYKFAGKGGSGKKDFVSVLPIPDTYRGKYRIDDGAAGKAFTADAMQILDQSDKPIAAFIAEPIVGCGGQVPLAKDYLKHLYPEIRKRGGLCISDEVQVGFGRLGRHFWGFEMHGVVPDIVVLGKPMGNGHPIGAVVTTNEIAEAFNNGMEFFSSFGGNPVSCAIGMALLEVIEEENLQQNALKTGNYFMDELRKLQKEFPQIGDVRGSGLFIGIDLVTDPETREPNTQLAQHLKNNLRENFILVSTDGPADNVIKVKGPVCLGNSNVKEIIEKLNLLFENFVKNVNSLDT